METNKTCRDYWQKFPLFSLVSFLLVLFENDNSSYGKKVASICWFDESSRIKEFQCLPWVFVFFVMQRPIDCWKSSISGHDSLSLIDHLLFINDQKKRSEGKLFMCISYNYLEELKFHFRKGIVKRYIFLLQRTEHLSIRCLLKLVAAGIPREKWPIS